MKTAIKISCNENFILDFQRYLSFYSEIQYQIADNIIYLVYDNDNIIEVEFLNALKYIYPNVSFIEDNLIIYSDIFSNNECNEKILPIKENTTITAFPNVLLLHQLPVDEYNYNSWLHCHYINIFFTPAGHFNYTDEDDFKEVCDCTELDYNNIMNYNNNTAFIKAIDNNFYIYLWIDNFFNNYSKYYKQWHDVHPILIYGYNKDNNAYYCAGFEPQKGLYYFSSNVDEIHLSFESARIHNQLLITEAPFKYFKPKDFISSYENAYGRFLHELSDYIDNKGPLIYAYKKVFKSNVDHRNLSYFGLDVTRSFIKGLICSTDYAAFDYRLLHLIIENKKLIYNSLKYFNPDNQNKDVNKLSELIEQYKNVCESYENNRLIYIKQSLRENKGTSFYSVPENQSIKNKIYDSLSSLIINEENILREIFPLLIKQNFIERQNFYSCVAVYPTKTFLGNDLHGHYYEISWDDECYISSVGLYSFYDFTDGILIFSDGSELLCSKRNSIYSFSLIEFDIKKISWIKFYPNKFLFNKDGSDFIIGAFKCNLFIFAKVIASSVFSERNDISFVAENVLIDNNDFWCPETFDKMRFIQFDFEEYQKINCIIIKESKFPHKLIEYKIDYYGDDGTWHNLLVENNFLGISKRHDFPTIQVKSIKFVILKTKVDSAGYDIPQITYLAAHLDLAQEINL